MEQPVVWWPRRGASRALGPNATSDPSPPQPGRLVDRRGRALKDLRLSVTDRCNFRCVYCMPREVYDARHAFLPHAELLTFEEMRLAAQAFVHLGVEKIRLTGGEPLLRKEVEVLVAMLAGLRTQRGLKPELAMTTNGSLLARKARALKDAGLDRVTVSLDALDDEVFLRMNDAGVRVAEVLAGIEAALEAGLTPLKVNMVVRRGLNDQQIVPMAAYFRQRPVELRFIEYMDVGHTNGWRMDEVLPSSEVLRQLRESFDLLPDGGKPHGQTAERWRHAHAPGRIGLISSVSRAFCADCERARLTTNGRMYSCLFAPHGHDLKGVLRSGATVEAVAAQVAHIWRAREDRYSELRGDAQRRTTAEQRAEMSFIGG